MESMQDTPTIKEISTYLSTQFCGINAINVWGEQSFFYNPDGLLKRGIYFCTIKEKDGAHDKASALNREGVFRINFGIPKQTFLSMFNILPGRPSQGSVIEGSYDFSALDFLTPHPIYGWMAWVSILNPSANSWENIKNLLVDSYYISVEKYSKKKINNVRK